jgi:hypothetical protein
VARAIRKYAFWGVIAVLLKATLSPFEDAHADPTDRPPVSLRSQIAEIGHFDLAAQPLNAALAAYGRATGLQLLYETGLIQDRVAPAVKGAMSAEVALAALLSGSGLRAAWTSKDSIALTRLPAQPLHGAALLPQSAVPAISYLQWAIMSKLCARPETRPGPYRAALRLNFHPDGQLDRAWLLDTTGEDGRDEKLIEALSTLRLPAADIGRLVQPVTMVILPRPPHISGDCRDATAAQSR